MNNIKIISIHQPYASFIISGKKTLEIRSWQTKYRGRLYIHSCKKPFIYNKLCGFLLGYVDLIDIRKMQPNDCQNACIGYNNNYYAWVLKNPVVITPMPIKGNQGIFGIKVKEAINLL